MILEKKTLYGVNISCPCGCVSLTHVFYSMDEAISLLEELKIRGRKRIRVVELLNCEDITDGRFIYHDKIITLGFNRFDLEGDKILKFESFA
jgi:hypothetical protein